MIRIANTSDKALVMKIHKESSKEIGGFNLFYSWTNFIEGNSPYKFYVIEGKAFMRFGYSKMLKSHTVKEIGVLNEHKGKGLAALFFKGMPKPVYLTCNTDNESGNAFYKKIGMRKAGVKQTKNKKKLMNVWVM